jgi:hypothetical protein
MRSWAIACARFAACLSPSLAWTIEPFIRMCHESANECGSRRPGFLGACLYDRADVLEVGGGRPAERVDLGAAELEQDVHK